MPRQSKRGQLFLGFMLLLLVGVALFALAKWILHSLININPQLGAALATGFVTVTVAVLSVTASKYFERRSIVEQALRQKKVPIYERLIDFIFRVTFAEKRGEAAPTEQEMVKFMTELSRDLVIWGSPDVVRAFSVFKQTSSKHATAGEPLAVMFLVEQVFRAIRKDLGHSDSTLRKGDILGIYINDIDQYL